MSIWKDSGCLPLEVKPKTDLASMSRLPLPNQLPYPKTTRTNKFGKEISVTRKSIKDIPVFGRNKYCGR